MPGSDDKKDEALKTPPAENHRTTPYEADGPLEVSTESGLLDAQLKALRQRYDLLGELGRGGMGVVYKARDRETGDVVAVKVLLPEIAARPDLIERFKSELLLARKITHKNVCRVYDLNRFGPVAAISMEYIEGESLGSLLNRVEGLSVRHGKKILRQILAGLAEAHAQGVIHRDLKPENIIIGRDGTVKVMDFGIARSTETDAAKTGTFSGTPAYMSPEQAEGTPPDPRTDIYALGLVMFEMFTGQRAFHADTPAGLVLKQIQEPPPLPRSVEPDLPEHIDRAIQRCLEKNPAKRFQSVDELVATLTKKPAAKPTEATSAEISLPPHLTRWQRSDFVLLAIALVGGFLFFVLQENTFPARRLQFSAGRQVAEKLASDFAQELELTPLEIQRSILDVAPWGRFIWRYGREDTYSNLTTWQPFRWIVLGRTDGEDETSTFIIDATTGDFIAYAKELSGLAPISPVQPPTDELQAHAHGLMEELFGISPEELTVDTEHLEEEQGHW